MINNEWPRIHANENADEEGAPRLSLVTSYPLPLRTASFTQRMSPFFIRVDS